MYRAVTIVVLLLDQQLVNSIGWEIAWNNFITDVFDLSDPRRYPIGNYGKWLIIGSYQFILEELFIQNALYIVRNVSSWKMFILVPGKK